jgi:hypothetical protein
MEWILRIADVQIGGKIKMHSVQAQVWTDAAAGAHLSDDIRFYVH